MPGHARKTDERAARLAAELYDPKGGLLIPRRICIACGRPANGHSYSTLYGYITVRVPGPTRDNRPLELRIQSCGEIVHHNCATSSTRNAPLRFSPARVESIREYNRQRKALETGIEYNASTGLYYPRVNKTRLQPVATLALARLARQEYMRKSYAPTPTKQSISRRRHRQAQDR